MHKVVQNKQNGQIIKELLWNCSTKSC